MPSADGFASSLAEGRDWSEAARLCLEGLDLPAGASLGFLYVTDHLADQLGSIVTLFRGVTGIERWVGTVGLGICGTGREVFDRPAVSALVTSLPPDASQLIPHLTDSTLPLEAAAAPWMAAKAPQLAIVHADGRHGGISALLPLVAEKIPFLVGGLASSRSEHAHVAGRLADGALSGVAFAGDVGLLTGLTQGCSPIGSLHTVTEADGNVILQVNGRPALDVFKEEIGPELANDLQKVGGLIFVGLPVPNSDTGDYLVRNIIAIDPARGWIAIGDTVEDGQPILFCRRDRGAAEADMARMLGQVKRRLRGKAPRAGLYISCVARGPSLFDEEGAELAMIVHELGDFPLAGFFANGEISHDRLYGYTGVLLVFT